MIGAFASRARAHHGSPDRRRRLLEVKLWLFGCGLDCRGRRDLVELELGLGATFEREDRFGALALDADQDELTARRSP